MGNQNATGLVGSEEKAANEEENHTIPVSSTKDEEKHILPEGEERDFHENAADSDPHDHVAIEKLPHMEKLTERGIQKNGAEHSPPPGFLEEANSTASEDYERKIDVSSSFHDQLSPLKGIQKNGAEHSPPPRFLEEANSTASEDYETKTDASSSFHDQLSPLKGIQKNGTEHSPPPRFLEEANCTASEDYETKTDEASSFHDQLSPLKGEVEGRNSSLDSKSNLNSEPHEHVNLPDESQQENEDLLSKYHLIDTSIEQNFEVEQNYLVVNDMASLEDAISDTSIPNKSSAAISEPPNEYLVIPEEMIPTVSEFENGENMSYGNQTQPLDKEIQLLSSSADQSETRMESESKEDEEELAFEINSGSSPQKVDPVEDTDEVIQMLVGTESGPTRECIATSKENGDEEATNEVILTKVIPGEEDASVTENFHENDNREGVADVQEYNGGEKLFRECSITNVSNEINETSTGHSLENTETELAQSDQTNSIPSQGGVGNSLELRKCPSFDFGVSFDARSEESDQTPLLYQEKTAIRSFSSCETLIRTSLQYDQEVGVEEKNIRLMERSNSENSRSLFLNAIKKEEKSIAICTEEKQGNNGDMNGDKDLQALESKEFGSNSPKGVAKRKPKSSIFTTCICCTAAIS